MGRAAWRRRQVPEFPVVGQFDAPVLVRVGGELVEVGRTAVPVRMDPWGGVRVDPADVAAAFGAGV